MNPGGIERVIAVGDFQEAGGLHKGPVAKARHPFQVLALAKRSVRGTVLAEASGGELIHARDVAEQSGAGGVHIHTNIVHTRLDDCVE